MSEGRRGATIMKWIEAGVQNDPNHEHFKNILEMPYQDVEVFLKAALVAKGKTDGVYGGTSLF